MSPAPRALLLLFLAGALAGGNAASAAGVFAASTLAPGNTLGTGTSAWFAANVTGTTLCGGTNALLACPFGTRAGVGTTVASSSFDAKAATTFTVAVVDGTGPAGISTIVKATFASSGTATAVLVAGAADTLDLTLKIKGGTATGTYTGTVVLTDTLTGLTAAFPISVTH